MFDRCNYDFFIIYCIISVVAHADTGVVMHWVSYGIFLAMWWHQCNNHEDDAFPLYYYPLPVLFFPGFLWTVPQFCK
jgi:hypothetical protein